MKLIYAFLFLFITGTQAFAQKNVAADKAPPAADKIMKEAGKLAKKEKKNIFLKSTASWCGWCRKMEAAMADPEIAPLLKPYYIIRFLDIQETGKNKKLENSGGDLIINKYGGKDQGLPYWVVLDAAGNMLANSKIKEAGKPLNGTEGANCGCPAEANEIDYFIRVLANTSKLNEDELQIIRKRFEKINTPAEK
jgi:thiol-disulfide isomerase/thioredoxin